MNIWTIGEVESPHNLLTYLLNSKKLIREEIDKIDKLLAITKSQLSQGVASKVIPVATKEIVKKEIVNPPVKSGIAPTKSEILDVIRKSSKAVDLTTIAMQFIGSKIEPNELVKVIVEKGISPLIHDGVIETIGNPPKYRVK